MTAIVANPFNIETDLNMGKEVLDKTAKLTERISIAVIDQLKREGVKIHVDHQFDVVIGSINEQLSLIEQDFSNICANLKFADQTLIDQINNPEVKRNYVGDNVEMISSMTIYILHLTQRSLEKTIQLLDQSGIERVCVGECIDKICAVNLRLYELCALVEQIAEHFRISNALMEKPITHSSNPIFNRLLEKYRA